MLPSTRRGATSLYLRLASFSTRTSFASRAINTQLSNPTISRSSRLQRPFSSISRHFQESVAEQPLLDDEPSPEFTQFSQLADAGVIDKTVIDTITKNMNIHTMTEVQRMTLNQCLDGQDVIAQARTGTGKTLAFLLPIVQRIIRGNPNLAQRSRRSNPGIDIRGLIILPTRELAEQVAVEAKRLTQNTGIMVQTAVGGTGKGFHLRSMQNYGCHLLIGTPGRLTDILSDRTSGVTLDNLETFVLDEADRLLDIGFAPAIEEIQEYMPKRDVVDRQTLMFSATVPKSVVSLVRQTMRPNFKFVRTVDPDEAPTHERVSQKVVFLNGLQNQSPAILEIAMKAIEAHKQDPVNNMPFKAIVYFGSTNEVNMAYNIFERMKDPSASGGRSMFAPHPLSPAKLFKINGKLMQTQRTREAAGFRAAESAVLFSSDVTARGMDFPNVSHVIQLGLPRATDDYIHRIGRTGRAGKAGEGWLLLNEDERRAYSKKMAHPSLRLEETNLATASLDMKKPAQIAAPVARMLQMVESGVKNVPYDTKRAVYQSLLGVMQQQFPDRQRQDQINMMNELARYGWGLQTPPPLPKVLIQRLGYSNCSGIELERDDDRRSGFRENRGQSQRGRSNGFSDRDPFGLGSGGKGVFGGPNEGARRGPRDAFDDTGSFGSDRRSFGRRSDRSDPFDGQRGRGSFGGRDSNRRGGSGRGGDMF